MGKSGINEIDLEKENKVLRKKVNELEMECFNLSYKHSEIVGKSKEQGTDQKMKAILEQLCHNVQKFMVAMKRLQRAVNHKD